MLAAPRAAGWMHLLRTRPWSARSWERRPSLDRTGTKPVGARPLVLVLALVAALVIHGFQRPIYRSPATVHGDILGKARVIDGDTIDISGVRIRLLGIDAP